MAAFKVMAYTFHTSMQQQKVSINMQCGERMYHLTCWLSLDVVMKWCLWVNLRMFTSSKKLIINVTSLFNSILGEQISVVRGTCEEKSNRKESNWSQHNGNQAGPPAGTIDLVFSITSLHTGSGTKWWK